jgi:hypothetical protein
MIGFCERSSEEGPVEGCLEEERSEDLGCFFTALADVRCTDDTDDDDECCLRAVGLKEL